MTKSEALRLIEIIAPGRSYFVNQQLLKNAGDPIARLICTISVVPGKSNKCSQVSGDTFDRCLEILREEFLRANPISADDESDADEIALATKASGGSI